MSRVLITFVGSHDLAQNNNGPIEQLIHYLKPSRTYIFITSEYAESFKINELEAYYNSIKEQTVYYNYTDIKNPTNTEEIVSNISDKINEINNYIIENKYQGFLNLTSGTPAILSVLSLFAITGQLNRTMGLYAPNPKYDNIIRTNSLDFYKNSFAYQTIKNLINQCDYIAIEDFIKRNKILPKLNELQEFKIIVSFAKNRVISNFELADEIYNKNEFLHEFNYKKPNNLYDKALESLMSAEISARNNDIFQTTLKLGIIRENLVSFLLQEILLKNHIDIIEINTNGEKRLKGDILEIKYPEILEFLQEKLCESTSENKKLDLHRELNSFIEKYLLEYFINKENDKTLNFIQKEFFKLEQLRKERNKLAHTINPPMYNSNWIQSIRKILINTAQYLDLSEPNFETYKEINKKLLEILKQAI